MFATQDLMYWKKEIYWIKVLFVSAKTEPQKKSFNLF